MRHVVVTGGAGVIGSHLVDALLGQGDRVTVLDNLSTGKQDNLRQHEGASDLTFVEQDICEPFDVDGPVERVYHLASPASPSDFTRLPLEILRVGSVGTENALELARRKDARILVASTSEIYGDPDVCPQPEEYWGRVNPIGPRSVYDEAKRYLEAVTMAYRRFRGVNTQIARIFNTYGPRMRSDDGRAIVNFITAALDDRPIPIFGDGSQTRSHCFVEDTVAGLQAVMEYADGEPVNVGRPGEMTILDFAKLIVEMTGSKSALEYHPMPKDDPKRREPVIARAEALGWAPRVALRDGLERTIAWFRAQRVSS